MRKKLSYLFTIAIFSSIIFSSCTKEYFNTDKIRNEQQQNVNIKAPLINTSLVLRDLLRDYDHEKLFEVDDDGFLSLIYNQTVFSKYAKDIVVLEDFSLPTDVLTETQISGNNKIISKNYNFDSFLGAQIDSINYHKITFEITVSHNIATSGALTIQFPGLTKNGSMAQLLITNLNGTTTQLFTGYELDLATNGPNNIKFNYVFDGWSGAASQTVNITISIKQQEYKTINGYIGNHILDFPKDSIYIDIFNKKFEGQFYFEDPKIKLTMYNSYGVPIKLNIDTIYGRNYDDIYSPLYYLGFEKNPVNYPTIKGEHALDSFTFDTTTAPWIREFITYKPKYIYFDGLGEINPDMIQNNFVLDTSIFKLNMKFIMPLWGRAEYPVLTDTVEVDIKKDVENIDDISYLKLTFDINNGMASEIRIQSYFIDKDGVVIDSLFKKKEDWIIIDGGITNSDGKVIQKTRKITDIIYNKDRIEKLKITTNMVYVAEIRTDGIEQGKLVKFYADDSIDIKMRVHVKGETDFNFDEN